MLRNAGKACATLTLSTSLLCGSGCGHTRLGICSSQNNYLVWCGQTLFLALLVSCRIRRSVQLSIIALEQCQSDRNLKLTLNLNMDNIVREYYIIHVWNHAV